MRRVFVIGLDALSPKLVERFAMEGICPNMRRIMDEGGFSKALPAIPAQTPENWTTIATGSWPGTHSIAVWGSHRYGELVTEKYGDEAMSSNLCRAEYLWEAASRQGLRSILFYFVGYPPTAENVIYIDWFWRPGRYYFELCSNACYVYPPFRGGLKDRGRWVIPIRFREAEGWKSIPYSRSKPLEAEIKVKPKVGGEGVKYHILLLDLDGQGYNRCLISRVKDASNAICTLKVGEWSDWFREKFNVRGRVKIGTVRFKLIELSKNGERFRLYRSQVYPISGFTHPPTIAKELVEKFGPYINEAASRLFFRGLIDEETLLEEFHYQIDWISKAAGYLMEKYKASIYMMHWHFLDVLEHRVLGLADPEGGMYDPSKADEAMRLLKMGYHVADELIGKFMEYLDDETYLIVVSDHGNSPNRKRYSIVKALAERGLIKVEKVNGEERINWSESKVYIDLTNVYINLKGRYLNGIVDESEYEEVRREVIDALRSCKDQDGEYVVAFALKREDAPIVGLWGEHIGDVVFTYSPGFTWGSRILEGGRSVKVGGANHGPQIPTAETQLSSNYATFMIIGRGIKKGYKRPIDWIGPVQLVDIAPTISYLLGIDPPRHSQGRILYDFLEGWDISEMKRERKPLTFPERAPLIGDVTDKDL